MSNQIFEQNSNELKPKNNSMEISSSNQQNQQNLLNAKLDKNQLINSSTHKSIKSTPTNQSNVKQTNCLMNNKNSSTPTATTTTNAIQSEIVDNCDFMNSVDNLSILVDRTINQKIADQDDSSSLSKLTPNHLIQNSNSASFDNLSTNHLKANHHLIAIDNNHQLTKMSKLKRPTDLLDAACKAITEDNPNLFNENFSFEINHSETDVNRCDLSEIVNNSILEHDLLIEQINNQPVEMVNDDDDDCELVENLILNVNEHQSKYTSTAASQIIFKNSTATINANDGDDKLNLISQPNTVNLVNNHNFNLLLNASSSSPLKQLNSNCSLNSSGSDSQNSGLNSLKKNSNMKKSNIHLSYLLQSKPQDLTPSNQLKHHLNTSNIAKQTDDNCDNLFG